MITKPQPALRPTRRTAQGNCARSKVHAPLTLVTVSLYGFWWWWEVNRQLRALEQPADPGRALAAVTVGWLLLIPPFLSVHQTATMIAEVQRRAGLTRTVNPAAAVAIAAVAGAGAIA